MQSLLIKRMNNFNFYKKFRIFQSDISALNGEIKIFHNGTCNGNYALVNESVEIIASMPREISVEDINVIFYDAYNCNERFKTLGKRINSDMRFDYFEFKVESMSRATLYFFYFEIKIITEFNASKY